MEKVDWRPANLAAGGDAVLEQAGQLFIVGIWDCYDLLHSRTILIITRWKKYN